MHGSIVHMLAAVFPAIIQLAWLGSLVLLFQGWKGILVFCFIWILKISYEKMALGKILKGLSISIPSTGFWITSVIHPWYVLGTAIGALFQITLGKAGNMAASSNFKGKNKIK
jgi:poly-beta-1,6-N-acetyl-D-glucosamine synthase